MVEDKLAQEILSVAHMVDKSGQSHGYSLAHSNWLVNVKRKEGTQYVVYENFLSLGTL